MFSTNYFPFEILFEMSTASCFNLDLYKILSSIKTHSEVHCRLESFMKLITERRNFRHGEFKAFADDRLKLIKMMVSL